ncbi:MAG: hypothetical protein AB7R69_02750 [Candidatus Babeliales bacterium]
MKFNTLIDKFNAGIVWNAYLYAIHRACSSAVTLLLFYKVPTYYFAAWANSNSVIYLILLWVDAGFRKSIPRYCPVFLKNKVTNKQFTKIIIAVQLAFLLLALPIIWYAARPIAALIERTDTKLTLLISSVFILEGILSILRLLYHAHFQQKFFNLLLSLFLILESATALILILNNTPLLIDALLINKIGIDIGAIGLLMYSLKRIYRDAQSNEALDAAAAYKEFIMHSGIMWTTSFLRSLSERNFMVPFLTYIAGAATANMYKLANDGALIFQRIALKTIGTTDTALLAYVYVEPYEKKLTNVAFRKLVTKVAALCLPLFGIMFFVMLYFYTTAYNTIVFQLFSLLGCSYLLEIMLIAYERMLEVQRAYRPLLSIYILYTLLLISILSALYFGWASVFLSLALISGVRLVSMFIMAYVAHARFAIHYPFKECVRMVSVLVFILALCLLLIYTMPPIVLSIIPH